MQYNVKDDAQKNTSAYLCALFIQNASLLSSLKDLGIGQICVDDLLSHILALLISPLDVLLSLEFLISCQHLQDNLAHCMAVTGACSGQ